MNDVQYLREERRELEKVCRENTSSMTKYVVSVWTVFGSLLAWIYDKEIEMFFYLIPMLLFITSVYIYISARVQIMYRLELLKLQVYSNLLYPINAWEKDRFRKAMYSGETEYLDSEYKILSFLTIVFTGICIAILSIKQNIDNAYFWVIVLIPEIVEFAHIFKNLSKKHFIEKRELCAWRLKTSA